LTGRSVTPTSCSIISSAKVYVQAKRWQGSVGRPDVQGFYGALAGQRANKGVFITTSTFSPQALEFARSVERIVLIDGPKLSSPSLSSEITPSMPPSPTPPTRCRSARLAP
jgi:restriction system protein